MGKDSRVVIERHYTDHNDPKKHSSPHDHKIVWDDKDDPQYIERINYRDGKIPKLRR